MNFMSNKPMNDFHDTEVFVSAVITFDTFQLAHVGKRCFHIQLTCMDVMGVSVLLTFFFQRRKPLSIYSFVSCQV